MDIFVDIANYSQDEELSERVKDAAGSVLSELSAAHPLPDLNALAELCYLCGQIGSRNSLDGLARLVRQEDAAKTIESSFEPLRLRALRCLVGLLADFQDDIEPTPYRSVLEACLQFEHCEKMALVGLTGLWPTDAEQAQYMLRIDDERRPLPNDLRLGLELAGFNRALSSPICLLKDDIQDSEDATGT